MNAVNIMKEVGIAGFIDIVFMSLIIYSVMLWFKKTKAAFVLTGILIIAGVYLLAQQFNLFLTAAVFRGFFAVILVALVVIFQEELRHFFEQVAVWSLNRRMKPRDRVRLTSQEVATLVRTLTDLAKERIGALIVIRGRDMIIRHLSGGIDLNGKLSEALLKSIFDPHSMGHDGAVIIERNKVTRFGCKLPLTKDLKSVGSAGTRHAAALGLSELTDALCLVVSEERGTISIARNGRLRHVKDAQDLSVELDHFYREVNPSPKKGALQEFYKKNSREKIIALGLAIALWFVLVHGSKSAYRTYTVPVEYSVLPSSLAIAQIEPQEVDVSLSGPRRAFYFLNKKKIKIFLKLWNLRDGTWKARIEKSDLSIPKNLVVENVEPPSVRVTVKTGERRSERPGHNVVVSAGGES